MSLTLYIKLYISDSCSRQSLAIWRGGGEGNCHHRPGRTGRVMMVQLGLGHFLCATNKLLTAVASSTVYICNSPGEKGSNVFRFSRFSSETKPKRKGYDRRKLKFDRIRQRSNRFKRFSKPFIQREFAECCSRTHSCDFFFFLLLLFHEAHDEQSRAFNRVGGNSGYWANVYCSGDREPRFNTRSRVSSALVHGQPQGNQERGVFCNEGDKSNLQKAVRSSERAVSGNGRDENMFTLFYIHGVSRLARNE